jgi:hypothetical protein
VLTGCKTDVFPSILTNKGNKRRRKKRKRL